MQNSKKLFFFNVLIFLSFVIAPSAYANKKKELLDRFKKPMPEIEKMSDKIFFEQTNIFRQESNADPALSYSIRIPKDWTRTEDDETSNFQVSDKLFTKIATFYGPISIYGQERLEIKAIALNFDMNAEEWFLQNLMSTGLTTTGYKFHTEKRVEAMTLMMDGDISYNLRSTVQMNGKKIIVADYYVPVDLWDASAALQERVVQSFKVLKPLEESVIQLVPYQVLDIAQINYPDFWEEKPDNLTSVETIGLKLFHYLQPTQDTQKKQKPTVQGWVNILLVANWSAESLLDEIEKYKKNSESNGLIIGEKIEDIKDIRYNELITFGATESYKIVSNEDNLRQYEFWFSILISGNYYYFISLTTPSRNENYATWVKNTRSFRSIVSNVKPTAEIKPE